MSLKTSVRWLTSLHWCTTVTQPDMRAMTVHEVQMLRTIWRVCKATNVRSFENLNLPSNFSCLLRWVGLWPRQLRRPLLLFSAYIEAWELFILYMVANCWSLADSRYSGTGSSSKWLKASEFEMSRWKLRASGWRRGGGTPHCSSSSSRTSCFSSIIWGTSFF